MISKEMLRDMPPKQRTYWTRAQEFAQRAGWELVEANTPEYEGWVRYFGWLGFKPHMLTLIERKVIEKIAVPSKFPEWFDTNYQDAGELHTKRWQDTPANPDKARAWLDRSDPVSSALVGDVPPKPAVPGQRVSYEEFVAHCIANNIASRPVGAFDPGGYLGASEINKASKRRVYNEREKYAFLENAKAVGKEIIGLKLRPETLDTLKQPDNMLGDDNSIHPRTD